MLGQRVNNFEIVRVLGEGGMGAVYEAKHPLIDKRVAIKVLKPALSVDAEQAARDQYSGDKALGGRLGLEIDELDFGVSGYTGRYTIEADQRLNIADVDISFRGEWLTVRTEGAIAFQELGAETLRKYGLYALVAVRPFAYLEPYAQYDLADVETRAQRGLLGFAFYPMPHERATRNLRLKSEAGYEFPQGGGKNFFWFFQLTTGF